jgi:TPR repeat protein
MTLTDQEFAEMLRKSENGNAVASIALAEHSLASGDRKGGKDYYIAAARQGNSIAANAVGALHAEDGEFEQAVYWFRIACNAGNKLACLTLSIGYRGGAFGLEPDKQKADWYFRLGDPGLKE